MYTPRIKIILLCACICVLLSDISTSGAFSPTKINYITRSSECRVQMGNYIKQIVALNYSTVELDFCWSSDKDNCGIWLLMHPWTSLPWEIAILNVFAACFCKFKMIPSIIIVDSGNGPLPVWYQNISRINSVATPAFNLLVLPWKYSKLKKHHLCHMK